MWTIINLKLLFQKCTKSMQYKSLDFFPDMIHFAFIFCMLLVIFLLSSVFSSSLFNVDKCTEMQICIQHNKLNDLALNAVRNIRWMATFT